MAYQIVSSPALPREEPLADRPEILRFVSFALSRWVVVLVCCSVAAALAWAGSLLQTKKYTATSSLLIEPPAGNDPRGATAISPIYLESLKTYERFASSDTLFARALNHLHLRQKLSGATVESIKKQVLRVTKPRDTKILEISATLPDAKDAQALAQYLAEETVQLSGALDRQSQQDLTAQVRQQFEAAGARLQQVDRRRNDFAASDPVQPLEAEIANLTQRKLRLQTELTDARIDLADYEARVQSRAGNDPDPRETVTMREQLAASKARIARIEKEKGELEAAAESKGSLLERRKHQRELLDNERQSARAQYELAASRQNDTLASAAFRSERLEVVDPGTVPERPSAPNTALNVAVALFTALIGSFLYLAWCFSLIVPGGRRYENERRSGR